MVDVIRRGNRIEYYKDGLLHREDGPAIIYDSGVSYWYKFGKIHRDDGPAVDWGNGECSWYRKGLYHRENGPAVEWGDERDWYINGIKATEKDTFIKLLIRFKVHDRKMTNLAREYMYDEEERRKLERLV